LHDEVVLRPDHSQAVEVSFAHQRLDVLRVLRRKIRRQLDDDAPGRKLQIHRVGRIRRAPVTGAGGGDYLRRRTPWRTRRIRQRARCKQRPDQGDA
jgi:hypothetical protein